jgi:hypothetical protein
MNPAFPLCRQPRHEDRVRTAIAACVSLLAERVPPSVLQAVVLTGSFARGEGSVLPRDGALHVLGDLEFFVVVTEARQARSLQRCAGAWGAEASARLQRLGVRADVEFGPLEVGFFSRRARPSIFVYDLRQHGKVVWGRGDVLEGIPAFGPEAIPRLDALHLLFNRTIEQLALHERLPAMATPDLLDAAYQRVKLTLDVAGSALAFAGMHVAQYRQRPAAFARLLAETPSLAALLPADVAASVREAARAKLDPTEGADWLPEGDDGARRARLRQAVLDAAPATAGLLTWELMALLGAPGAGAPSLTGLLERYVASPPVSRRVRDWAKAILHPLPPPLPLAPGAVARLAWASTPRALLYAAGALAYLAMAGRVEQAVVNAFLERALPLAPAARPRRAAAQRQAIVALWTWCVRNQ